MKACRYFFAGGLIWLAMVCGGPLRAAEEITNLNALKSLGPGKAAAGRGFRVRGVVVCYDAGWHQLYLHDGRETLYFNADDVQTKPQTGQLVELTGTAYGSDTFAKLELKVLGQGGLPNATRLDLSELARDHGEWIETAGQVLSAETSRGRLSLLLHDQRQNCLVYVLGSPPGSEVQHWRGCRVRVRGINASKTNGTGLEPAMIFAPGPDEVKVMEPANWGLPDIPVVSIGSLLNRELGSWTNHWVHVNGLVNSYEPGRSLVVQDPTGIIRAQVVQLTEIRGDERVEVWGFLEVGFKETFLDCAYFEVVHPATYGARESSINVAAPDTSIPRVLLRIPDILNLRREEAARHLPVRLRGVMTFADPEWRNGFIQDGGDAVYVYLPANGPAVQSGKWVELTGVTSPGGFAPEVLSSRVELLGMTNLPTAPPVDLEDLANGHLDAHWVEMEGVVRRVNKQSGHLTLWLMTAKGRFKVMIPGFENLPLPTELIDALVRVQGACISELNARRQLSGITLHAPGLEQVTVIAPQAADPFAIGTTGIAAVGTFDPGRAESRRVKIGGVVTLRMAGQGFIVQDSSGGMRVLTREADEPQVGDQVEVLGFPAIGDFSPYLEEAIFRKTGTGLLPERKQLTAEQILLQGTNDAQIVEVRARLLQSVPRSANPQLVLQDGPIIFTAQVEPQSRRRDLPALRSGSVVLVSGVCSIQGGERHEPETFWLLLRGPEGIELLEAPPWWTSRQAFAAAGGMSVAIAATLAWVRLLRRQVRRQTRMIRQKLEDAAALEHEVLEISNREQRRIGHDLHDGVCQQLAGIAFLTSTLAEELGEHGLPQEARAERICTMINEVIDQTRNVARGLFPIRLEENGLGFALEELAANASEIFKINCRFITDKPPGEVENATALHLYYIVLEAVANAAKHGQAKNVSITLEPAADRYSLSVRDDGAGFCLGGAAPAGMGLRIMNYRARVIGATLQIESQPRAGTRVACFFLPAPEKPGRFTGQKIVNDVPVRSGV